MASSFLRKIEAMCQKEMAAILERGVEIAKWLTIKQYYQGMILINLGTVANSLKFCNKLIVNVIDILYL